MPMTLEEAAERLAAAQMVPSREEARDLSNGVLDAVLLRVLADNAALRGEMAAIKDMLRVQMADRYRDKKMALPPEYHVGGSCRTPQPGAN